MERSIVIKMVIKFVVMITVIGLTSCSNLSPSRPPSTKAIQHRPGMTPSAIWVSDNTVVWEKLQHISSTRLAYMQSKEPDSVKSGWIELALISKRNSVNTQQLARKLLAWRETHPSHPANPLLPDNETLNQLTHFPPPQRIAVLLPQEGTYASSGQSIREGFLNAYYKNLPNVHKQNIKFYDTSQSMTISDLYQQALSDGADVVIGPLVKENVQQLRGSGSFQSPILALNYTDTHDGSLPSNFYEFGLLPEDESGQIADRARHAGHAHAIVIAPQNGWGKRLVSAFSARWQSLGGSISDTYYYLPQANFTQDIAHLLNENNKFDVVFLFSQPEAARTIVPLLRNNYAINIPIYATSATYAGKPDPKKDVSLNGAIICDIPWNMQVPKHNTSDTIQSDRLYAVGQDAYLLSQAMQRLEQLPNFSIYGTTGALTLSTSHQIHRRLPCMQIHNGRM
jgi:uncharacterized protein